MIIFIPKRTRAILIKLNTSPDCQGVNSRAFLKKDKNRLKIGLSKIALEVNPSIQGP